ncbi:MAG: calcium/sodium antiporter [Bacteroidetes bacterium]|nr:calcium/sodium antiporter [Bacteroidota bacterium]
MVYVLFAIGFVILTIGANWMVDGASAIARRFNISDLVIGLTLVAFGTSAPELVVNIMASVSGNTDLAISNVIGSNILNILLILGLSALVFPLVATKEMTYRLIPFSFLAVVAVFVLANDGLFDGEVLSVISRSDGIILLAFFGIFMYYTVATSRNSTAPPQDTSKLMPVGIATGKVILGIAGLVFGGKWIVDGAIEIASYFHMQESLIGLTIVAVGTSLPEIATSVVAAMKKNTDIAIGNIVGSNVMNIFFILGISSSIRPLPFNPEGNRDMIMLFIASLYLFIFIFIGRGNKISRVEGAFFLFTYLAYIAFAIATLT